MLNWIKQQFQNCDQDLLQKRMGDVVFTVRWILYPINIGLILALVFYVLQFVQEDFVFIHRAIANYFEPTDQRETLESLMVVLLGFVDASMVANLIIMIVQSGHEIFIHRFEVKESDKPQYLSHMDTGIMKIKVALSISSITLVQILKDFVNLEFIEWETAVHRMIIHIVALFSALVMAIIWRISHSNSDKHSEVKVSGEHFNSHGGK